MESYPADRIRQRIYLVRGRRVMLDRDLAEIYGVKGIRLRQQVKRNADRFPPDFMFRLSEEETRVMVSQNAIPSWKFLGGHLPYAFTQEGVAMLSSVLRSRHAVRVNVAVMRAFVKLRETLALHKELARNLADLEKRVSGHDENIQEIFAAIRRLMEPPESPKPRIGFKPGG